MSNVYYYGAALLALEGDSQRVLCGSWDHRPLHHHYHHYHQQLHVPEEY